MNHSYLSKSMLPFLLGSILFVAQPLSASLFGDTVTANLKQLYATDNFNPNSAVVAGGAEFSLNVTFGQNDNIFSAVNFGGDFFQFYLGNMSDTKAFNWGLTQLVVGSLDSPLGAIVGVKIDPLYTTFPENKIGLITFTADSVTVNFKEPVIPAKTTYLVSFDLEFANSPVAVPPPSEVPEPATLAATGLALALLLRHHIQKG